jgi:hypothetical protein
MGAFFFSAPLVAHIGYNFCQSDQSLVVRRLAQSWQPAITAETVML